MVGMVVLELRLFCQTIISKVKNELKPLLAAVITICSAVSPVIRFVMF